MAQMILFPDSSYGALDIAYFDAGESAPEVDPICYANNNIVQFSQAALNITCTPDKIPDEPYVVYLEVSFGYRGRVYRLDYNSLPLARKLDSLNLNVSPEIKSDGYERIPMRTYNLPLARGRSILLAPGQQLGVRVRRITGVKDGYDGKLVVTVAGEVHDGMQVIPRRVRTRRRNVMLADVN